MIDLVQSASPSPLLQTLSTDPGSEWSRDAVCALEPPADEAVDPAPEREWKTEETRTGIYGVVSPRIIALPVGGYRMYYTQLMPRDRFPSGANDYDNASARILSATSVDGVQWTPEEGVRLSPQLGGAGDLRVVSSEVVPIEKSGARLRMYYECCGGPQSQPNAIRSAISEDGLAWRPEPGVRLASAGRNYCAPRIVYLNDGGYRLYCHERGRGIISAVSADGVTFREETGVRIAPDTPSDQWTAFAPEILRVNGVGYRMYYAGYSSPSRAQILTAVSADGLLWEKEREPVIAPNGSGIDAAKAAEMCVVQLHEHPGPGGRYRMFYEACDGSARDQRGVWRIASATSAC